MKRLLILLILAGVFWGRLDADGKVFPPAAIPTEVRIPDQRALLSWSNGVERLIIETRFTGAGNQFAWVVPLPAPPVVEPASRGLFPTLLHLTAPEVVHAPPRVWLWALLIGLCLILAIRMRSIVEALCTFAILTIVAGMLLPAASMTKAGGTSGAEVEILDRQLAGVFESTTISGKDPSALREWLVREGYRVPPDIEPVIADYVQEGWVFVASKVRRDTSEAVAAAMHPLSFTFPSPEPVYPLRLTGVGNGNLEVELFVFGPGTAICPGFRVEDSRPTGDEPKSPSRDYFVPIGHLSLRHEALFAAAAGAPWATRLRGVLSPARMTADAVIRWAPARQRRAVLYSHEGAWRFMANITVPALALVVIVQVWGVRWRGWKPRMAWRRGVMAGIAAAAVTALGVAALPKVPVRVETRYRPWIDALSLQYAVRWALRAGLDTHAPVTVDAVRDFIRRELPAMLPRVSSRPLSLRIREEDAPYMYSLRPRTNGVDLIFHDATGGERERIALPEAP
ncbi:MAG: DUF2330 domain-containing protein [Verrucomicrobia bacterium]|nr:DUF2330 domain-containing protein [Verrucomicrobiota bacterium]